jgi:hypothetical protein
MNRKESHGLAGIVEGKNPSIKTFTVKDGMNPSLAATQKTTAVFRPTPPPAPPPAPAKKQ